jgi:hypothetical protein
VRLFGNLVLAVGRGRPSRETSTDKKRETQGQGFDPWPQARTEPLGANVDTKSCVAQEAAGIYPRQSVTILGIGRAASSILRLTMRASSL